MIIDLDINLHAKIHREVRAIKVPSAVDAMVVYQRLCALEETGGISENDPLERRLQVIISLFRGLDEAVADDFKRQLRAVRPDLAVIKDDP